MNTQLAIDEVDSNKTITDVYAALEEGGMTAKDYHPLASGTYFFWDSELNRVLYTDDEYNVQYPEEYKDVKSTDDKHQWYSLNNEIKGETTYTSSKMDDTTTISVKSSGELYQAIQNLEKTTNPITLRNEKKDDNGNVTQTKIEAFFEHAIEEATVIELTQDIDMMGASFDIGYVSANLTINGNGHTISGISNLENAVDGSALNEDGVKKNYYCGLVQYVEGTDDTTVEVTIKNIVLENVVIGNDTTGSSGILVGNAKNATINIEGVKIVNATLYGDNKLGAFVGAQYSGGCNVNIKKKSEGGTVETKLEGVNIISRGGEAGLLFGSTDNGGQNNKKIKIDSSLFGTDGSINFITDCTVICNCSEVKDADSTKVGGATNFNETLDKKIVKKYDQENDKYKDIYRPTTAFIGFVGTGNNVKYPDTESGLNPINTYDQAVSAGWIYNFGTGSAVTAQ